MELKVVLIRRSSLTLAAFAYLCPSVLGSKQRTTAVAPKIFWLVFVLPIVHPLSHLWFTFGCLLYRKIYLISSIVPTVLFV